MKDKQVCMSWNGKLLCFMERVRVMNNKNGVCESQDHFLLQELNTNHESIKTLKNE